MLKDIVEARTSANQRIFIRFKDEVEGEASLTALVSFHGAFASLKDSEEVRKVEVNPDQRSGCPPCGAYLNSQVLYSPTHERFDLGRNSACRRTLRQNA